MLSISAAVITWAASAVADSPNVKGDYGFTGTNSCIHAAGFTGVNGGFVATSSGAFESAAVEGIQSFNGDGTGTVTGSGLVLQFFALSPPWGVESPVNFTFSFTYTVNADSTWTSVGGPVTSTVTGGPRKGQTVTFNGFPLTGRISKNGMTLTAAELTPTVETMIFSNGDVDQRTCQRSWVLISLQGNQNRQGNQNGQGNGQ
jgi:hypothetical protein